MNNVKFTNALVAVADAVGSLAQDYESQIAQLKQHNEALAKQLAASTRERDNVISIFQNVQGAMEERIALVSTGGRSDPVLVCKWVLDELEKTSWLTPLPNRTQGNHNPAGSPGLPPQPPTSKASTPSA